MTPAKLNAGEPTAVKRDPTDQKITQKVKPELILQKHKKNIEKEE